jgi:nucleotide-binding universal stress UspA family protein
MFEKMIVPLDRSALAECVLPHAIAMSQALNCGIVLLHVLSIRDEMTGRRAVDPLDWNLRKAEAETYLQGIAAQLQEAGSSVETQLLEGDAAEQISDYARHTNACLMILSSHGQSGLTGWNVSGVVQKIIMRSYISLLIVRAYRPVPPADTPLLYQRILMPLDGSARAECVLPIASALLRNHATQLLLAHVVQRPELPRRTPLSPEEVDLVERLVERNRAEAEVYLGTVQARFEGEDVEVRLVVVDQVARALEDLAAHEEVDLVLLAAHGYSGESRWPYGSVVANFIAYGSAPLLVVQDVPADRAEATEAEIAAQNLGRR